MKIILSRKGFDSSFGGVPSLIRDDGTMLSAPIPEMNEKGVFFDTGKRYNDLQNFELPPKCKYKLDTFCHLDPDIRKWLHTQLPQGWEPILGQCGAAASHLKNNKIGKEDIFIFWGLFQKIGEPYPFHAIWGYMQIAEIVKDFEKIQKYSWHPHSREYYCGKNSAWKNTNTLYIGTEKLLGISDINETPGYGTFKYDDKSRNLLKLTRDGDPYPSHWRFDSLPWLDWNQHQSNMTYHKNTKRFVQNGPYFQAASRGQEFVVNHVNETTTLYWLPKLLKCRNPI